MDDAARKDKDAPGPFGTEKNPCSEGDIILPAPRSNEAHSVSSVREDGSEAARQRNERKSTRYEGVYQRESRSKRYRGKPDVCYSIDYRDPLTGKRVRRTIGWKSQEIDAEYAYGVRIQLLGQGARDKLGKATPVKPDKSLCLADAWLVYKKDWLDLRQVGNTKTLAGLYNNHLQGLSPLPLDRISALDLERLAAGMLRKGLSAATAKHALALVRQIMRKMIAWKLWTGPTPFADVTMPRTNNQRQRYLTPEEAVAVLEALKGLCPRMWLISLLSLHCGLRFGEAAALRRADIDFTAGTIFIRDPKSGRDRHALMTHTVLESLRAYENRPQSSLLFPTRKGTVLREKDDIFEDVINAFEMNYGINDARQKVVFHSLRHTYASWLARAGSGQSVIADLLGHASLQMSKRYTHLMPDSRREAAAAIDSLFTCAHGRESPQ